MSSAADGRAGITASLVRRLVAEQFPQWVGEPVVPVEPDGWDNRTYRLGHELTVRLPTDASYVATVSKEDRWLPVLAPQLPLQVPVPVATGRPGPGYPHPWSVRRWIAGRPVTLERLRDPVALARTLAAFLRALQRIDPRGGPAAGAHSFHRGRSPGHYDDEVQAALAALGPRVDADGVGEVWRAALASQWWGPPVRFHGDIAIGNLLLDDQGQLTAVIDFGTSGVGDPACDLVIAWTLLRGQARAVFNEELNFDEGTWARARGWALWKALTVLVAGPDPEEEQDQQAVVREVLLDHAAH